MHTLLFALLTVRPATIPAWVFVAGFVVFGLVFANGLRLRGKGE